VHLAKVRATESNKNSSTHFLEAVKENDQQPYLTSLLAMRAMMFSSDHLY